MSSRNRRDDEKKSSKKPADKPAEKTSEELAAEAAVAEAAKVADAAAAEATAAAAKAAEAEAALNALKANPPEGACEVYGQLDRGSKCCLACEKDYPEAYAACMTLTTATQKAKKVKPAAAGMPKPRAPRPVGDGTFSKFGHCKGGSQAYKIEVCLENPVTYDEIMAAVPGASLSRIKSHVHWLVTNHANTCTKVAEGNKIHFVLKEAPAAAA